MALLCLNPAERRPKPDSQADVSVTWGGGYCGSHSSLSLSPPQESEGVSCHYWSLFDGHAGSGAAVVASRLLQHHVTEQLQAIVDILKNSAVLPPTCLGDEPEHTPASGRTLTRAASLRGGGGAPGSPSTPPTRFFTEKKIAHECLVIGALESAFKEMVGMAEEPGAAGAGRPLTPNPCFLRAPCLTRPVSDPSTCWAVHVRSPFYNRVSILSGSWRRDGVPCLSLLAKIKKVVKVRDGACSSKLIK